MLNKIKLLPAILAIYAIINLGYSQQIDVWEAKGARKISSKNINLNGQVYKLNDAALKEILFNAPKRMTGSKTSKKLIYFPMPDGTKEVFETFEHSVLSKELALKFPNIKSYYARSLKNPLNTIRFSLDDFGFHGMIFFNKKTYFINPEDKNNKTYFIASKKDFNTKKSFGCAFDDSTIVESIEKEMSTLQRTVDDGLLRTFRLALACTGEYATYHINQAGVSAGTDDQKRATVLSAMNTTMTRVNEIYEREFSITMEIIPNNEALIFLDAETDGYTNDDGNTMLNENQEIIDEIIGTADYDIGHVFSTGGGGIATLNSPCFAAWKAQGVTGLTSPVGDAFNIDFVSHEMGHQFGAGHTQNNDCSRSNGTAVEPGSGSTIMGYAGICAPNVQSSSGAYFHAVSIEQIWQNITFGNSTCAATQVTGNTAPTVSGGNDYNIPQGTPFVLEAIGNDIDGDLITYCWEQIDNQIGEIMPPVPEATVGPVFRSRLPSDLPTRYFPQTQDLLNNNLSPTWEVIPTVSRNMNFSVLVRDNNLLGGQTARDDVQIIVDGASGPFQVTSHSVGETLSAGQITTVNWDVANTNAAPISTSLVSIYLVVDNDFENLVLVDQNVANDGSHNISIPTGITSSVVRIMVKAEDNVFFALNSQNLTIQQSEFVLNFDDIEFSVCQPDDIVFNFTYNTFVGFSETVTFTAIDVPAGLNVSFSPNAASNDGDMVEVTVTGTNNIALGNSNFTINASSLSITRDYPINMNVLNSVVAEPNLLLPATNSVNIPFNQVLSWEADNNAEQYEFQISTQLDFSTILESYIGSSTTFSPTVLQSNTQYYWRVKSSNNCGEGLFSSPFTFTTIEVSCKDFTNNQSVTISDEVNTVTSIINVTDQGILQDINVSLNITHTYVQDLTITLTSPAGTVVSLINQGCNENDNIVATFDDDGSTISCGINPAISGVIIPENPLSFFNDEQIAGTWMLTVIDNELEDGGSINSFGINICVSGSFESDTDGDGIIDVNDLCPVTPSETNVDVNGCPVFTLPSDNYLVRVVSESCRGGSDGSINITAEQTLNYTATLSGGSGQQNFTNTTEFAGISAGNYTVCITLSSEPDYQQCFDVVITQPELLLVASKLNPGANTVDLTLEGGNIYSVELNGIITQTRENKITLELDGGVNSLKVTTDKNCQGVYVEEFFIHDKISAYPNPFVSNITINTGIRNKLVNVTVYSILGELVLSNSTNTNGRGETVLDLKKLPTGVYLVNIKNEELNTTYKIIRE